MQAVAGAVNDGKVANGLVALHAGVASDRNCMSSALVALAAAILMRQASTNHLR